jgi:hypothetical protein
MKTLKECLREQGIMKPKDVLRAVVIVVVSQRRQGQK